jgi:transcriptional regulator with XRE-family HTH domain
MHRFATRITQPAMSPDEQPYFQALGARIAKARAAADLTQVQLAATLGISQPQLAFYEVGKRRVPVSMLPRLAKALALPVEALIADNETTNLAATSPRRTRKGPVSKLEQQFEAVAKLPKAEQRFVSKMLDNALAGQTSTGQTA